jgi:hypothetical protein
MPRAPFNYVDHVVIECSSCRVTAACNIRHVCQGDEMPIPTLPEGWTVYVDGDWHKLLCPKHRAIVDIIDVRNL